MDAEQRRGRGNSPDEGDPPEDARAQPESPRPAESEPGAEPASEPGPPSTPRRRRRARTEPPPGSDPHPAPEPPRHASTDNDARLRGDKPPHY